MSDLNKCICLYNVIKPGTGNIDRSYWAEDCFHPGRKAHYAMGTSLWNTMVRYIHYK